jgi:tripartite-type tricarboxylate transporter receptor subunit TctC
MRKATMASLSRRDAVALCATAALTWTRAVRADEPFYKGKTLTVLINFAAGGPTDIEGRLFAKHIVKHIDGNPTLIVQNKDGAAGMVGAAYLGEVGPRDGTMVGYLTGMAWSYVIDPAAYRVDVRDYAYIGYIPGTTVYYMRTDVPPGMKQPADIMKAQGLVMGGLGVDSAKDLLQRLTFDMLGLQYRYVTGYRSSNTARLAVLNGEINMHSESQPAYFGVIEPTLVKTGKLMPLWYDPDSDGKTVGPYKVMEHTSILPYDAFYKSVKGAPPSGPLWQAYMTSLSVNGRLQRIVAMPPGSPPAAVAAMRKAVAALNDDADYAADAMKTIQFVPHYEVSPDLDKEVAARLTIPADTRAFILDYMKKVAP